MASGSLTLSELVISIAVPNLSRVIKVLRSRQIGRLARLQNRSNGLFSAAFAWDWVPQLAVRVMQRVAAGLSLLLGRRRDVRLTTDKPRMRMGGAGSGWLASHGARANRESHLCLRPLLTRRVPGRKRMFAQGTERNGKAVRRACAWTCW